MLVEKETIRRDRYGEEKEKYLHRVGWDTGAKERIE